MKKRLVALSLILCLLLTTFPLSTLASSDDARTAESNTSPAKWSNTSSVILAMSYKNNGVSWSCAVTGYTSTANITATVYLDKKNANGTYTYLNHWTNHIKDISLMASGFQTTAKGTYRLRADITVTNKSGVREDITLTLEKTFT